MRHKWIKEERVSNGRSYSVLICSNCGHIKEKAWTGFLYYPKGYDPVTNNAGNAGIFSHLPGECITNPPTATER